MTHFFSILTALLVVGMGAVGVVSAEETTTALISPTTSATTTMTAANQTSNETSSSGINLNINVGGGGSSTSTATTRTATPTPAPLPNGSEAVDRIDGTTLLMNKSYYANDDGTGGTAILVIKSERYQQISVTDAMGFSKAEGNRGADINHEEQWINRGETARFELDITESDNWAGVVIGTDSKLRAYEMSDGGGKSPLERTTSTAGWIGGAGVAIAMFGAAAYQRRHKDWPAVEEVN